MNGIESRDGTIDTGALWQLLQELEAGAIGLEQRDELMALIERSPAAQRAYLDYFEMAAILEAEATTHAEQGKLPVVGQARLPIRIFRRSVLAAAAVLILAAIVAALVMVKPPEPGHLTAAATADTKWMVDGEVQDPAVGEWTVAAGSTVQVWSGTVKLRLESGAAMVMQGPAQASFPELDKPVLKNGWLWIDSGDSDDPLEIDTPELLVRDIGTRFGVRVPEEGPAEVHLLEGAVEVFARSTGQKIATLKPEERGFAMTASGEMAGLVLARDPFPDLSDLLAAPANYPTTVRSQNPAGYWRMEDTTPGSLANEVPEGRVGHRPATVTMDEPGPGPGGGFHGFGEENHAARLPGASARAPLALSTTPIHTGVLFRDEFKGAGSLHGTTPDVATGNVKWLAASSPSNFAANGAFSGGGSGSSRGGSATLAFAPVDGVIYTLDASLRGVTGNEDWIALGFAHGQSAAGNSSSRFIDGSVAGRAWMLLKGTASGIPTANGSDENKAFLGTTGSNGGIADGVAFSTFTAGSHPDMDLRIVLDTTGGPGTWTATWYAMRPAESRYTMVRGASPLLNESITAVGFAVAGGGISGAIESFSLLADRKPSAAPFPRPVGEAVRVSRKEGAVSFWIRRETSGKPREILWAAGERKADDAIHAHLTADGRAGFFMENGRYDVMISSEKIVTDGQWHHLAASWNPSAVDLYVDGKRVARDTEFRGMQQGILPEVRFGSGAAGSGAAPFSGWVDEIALWDRALTPAEVVHQFRSARGR